MSKSSEMAAMSTVLLLGSGSVSRPCAQYLLAKGYRTVVVDVNEAAIRRTLSGHENGVAVVADGAARAEELIEEWRPAVVVCLLPTVFMATIAAVCVKSGVSMIGASYVKDELRALDAKARKRGVTLLCEAGLDPGIDHMSAVTEIRRIMSRGGTVESFISMCGALPDLAANNNPIGYKLSWAPASLIGASKRSARILADGVVVELPDGATYQSPEYFHVGGLGWFESYANADSLPYREGYGIESAKTIKRGTLRYFGWCDMITQMQKLDLFSEDERDFTGETYSSLIKKQAAGAGIGKPADQVLGDFLGLAPYAPAIMRLAWLGFLDDKPVRPERGSLRDVVSQLYAEKLVFEQSERDLVAMQHEFIASYPGGKREKTVSTLISTGEVSGDTAIARTTGLPMGICAHLVASGGVSERGVIIPTLAAIYEPCLAELEREGITFSSETEAL